jgi:serine/threonine protein kinase
MCFGKYRLVNFVSRTLNGTACVVCFDGEDEFYLLKRSSLEKIKENWSGDQPQKESAFLREVQPSVYFPKFKAEEEKNGYHYLAMEYIRGEELLSAVQKQENKRYSVEEARRIFRQICEAVKEMHEKGITHRDISLENIMIDVEGNIKIIDFGRAQFEKDNVPMIPAKPMYTAPEVFSQEEVADAVKCDIWPLGVILFVLLTGLMPFQIPSMKDVYFKNMYDGGIWEMHRKYDWLKHLPVNAVDLIARILTPQEKRVSMDDILSHQFFL